MKKLFNKIFSFRTLYIIFLIFSLIFSFAFYLGFILGKDIDSVFILCCFSLCQFEFFYFIDNVFSLSDKIENNKIKEAKK